MKFRISKMLRRSGAVVIALTMALSLSFSVFAADYGTATSDTIDPNEKGSITIYKYDQTAMEADGLSLNSFYADGERNLTAESKLAEYAIQGVVFDYIRVGDIKTYTTGSQVQVEYGFSDNELITAIGLNKSESLEHSGSTYYFSSTQINNALAESLQADNTMTKNTLETYLRSHEGAKAAGQFTETDANGKTSVSGLSVGLYLIVETYVPEDVVYTTNPFFVSIPSTDADGEYWYYDVYVYPKNQTDYPTLDKTMADADDVSVANDDRYYDTATASEGDVVNYRLTSELPRITSTTSYLTKYTYVDQLSKGLQYNNDVRIAFYSSEADAQKNNVKNAICDWGANDGYFTANIQNSADGSSQLTVSMTSYGLKEINPNMSEKYMVVYYTATVKSDAAKMVVLGDGGNPNDVTLTYSRTNTSYDDHVDDEAILFTYGLNVTKLFSDNAGDPTQVQFVLKNTADGYYVTAKAASGGTYDVTGESVDASGAAVFSPNADGSLVINGLEADTYELTEITTDSGCSLLKDSIKIAIIGTNTSITPSQATVRGQVNPYAKVIVTMNDSASATVDTLSANMSAHGDSEHARVDFTVTNNPTFTMPRTGGYGTWFVTIGGIAGIALAVFVLVKVNKRKAD